MIDEFDRLMRGDLGEFPTIGCEGVALDNIDKDQIGGLSILGLYFEGKALSDVKKDQGVIIVGKEDVYYLIQPTSWESIKTDISDMKATVGDVKGLKILNVLEVKGGDIGINEYSDDVCKSLTTTLTKLAEFNISTPSPPSGLIVYKRALMISVQCRYQSTVSGYYLKIYVDGEDKFTIPITGTLTWFDRALDVNAGTHTVQIWCYNLVGNCPDYGVKSIKAQCGIGTVSTSEVKVAEVETCGEGRGDLAVVGKSYGEDATITGTQKVDDSDADKVSASGNVTKGGTSYGYSAYLSGAMYNARNTYYGKTSTGNVPIFHNYSKTVVRRAVK